MIGFKFSKYWYVRLVALFYSICVTATLMAIFTYTMGVGRAFFHTSAPEELYGGLGWFSICIYMCYLCIITGIIRLLLVIFKPMICDYTEPDTHE